MAQSRQRESALPDPASLTFVERPFGLADEQQRVYDILAEWKPEIAKMYEACHLVLSRVDHDEKLALAAHAARETMSAIAEAYGVTWDESRLHTELNVLKTSFKRVPPGLLSGGDLPESIAPDSGLLNFLQKFDGFAKWYGDEIGPRRKQAENLFKKLIDNPQPAVCQGLAASWVDVHRFFSGVCHHDEVSPEEFQTHISQLEHLITTTRLEAVDDLDAIDRLIKGEGPDGHS